MGFRYIVRPAKLEDCGSIMGLIKELDEFDGPEHLDLTVQITEQDLQNDTFGEHALCRYLVVDSVQDEVAADRTDPERVAMVGYAAYFYVYHSWTGKLIFLEALFVQSAHRGNGIGKVLLCKVAKIGAEKGCKGMQWFVLGSNESARQFYATANATDMTAEDGWRLIGSQGHSFVTLANLVPKPGRLDDRDGPVGGP